MVWWRLVLSRTSCSVHLWRFSVVQHRQDHHHLHHASLMPDDRWIASEGCEEPWRATEGHLLVVSDGGDCGRLWDCSGPPWWSRHREDHESLVHPPQVQSQCKSSDTVCRRIVPHCQVWTLWSGLDFRTTSWWSKMLRATHCPSSVQPRAGGDLTPPFCSVSVDMSYE